MIFEASNLILCFTVTLIWGGKYRHLHHSPLFIYQIDSWFLSTSAGIIRITWKLSPVLTLSRTCQDGSLGKSSPGVGLASHGKNPSPNSCPARWGEVGVVPVFLFCILTKALVTPKQTLRWNQDIAACELWALPWTEATCRVSGPLWCRPGYCGCLLKSAFSPSSFPLLLASASHSPRWHKLRSILLFSSCNRWTWMSSQGLQFQAPLAIRCGYDWVLFQGEVSSCNVGGKDQWDLGNIWEILWTRTPAHVKYFPGLTVWGRNFNCIWNMIYLSQFVTTQLPLLTDTFHYALSLETCLAYIFSLWAS